MGDIAYGFSNFLYTVAATVDDQKDSEDSDGKCQQLELRFKLRQ